MNTTTQEKPNVLLVCTAGQHRSPTAARLLENNFDVSTKSCGVHPQASEPVTQELINWADHIITMDERTDGHKTYLEDNFELGKRPVYIFDIPDIYSKDDPELIDLLEDKLQVFVDRLDNSSA